MNLKCASLIVIFSFFLSFLVYQAIAAEKMIKLQPVSRIPERPTITKSKPQTVTTKTPNKINPVNKFPKKIAPIGYCCKDGKSSPSTKADCQRLRGKYFATEREAISNCTGFCCIDGTVTKSTETNCKKKHGTFYHSRREAAKKCQGYCCADFKVSQATRQKCKRGKGFFFSNRQQAVRFCENQKGYCNVLGKTQRFTQDQCNRKKGKFFVKERQARKSFLKIRKQELAQKNSLKKAALTNGQTPGNIKVKQDFLQTIKLPTDGDCREYAQKAVDMAELAERSYCNFSGDRWSNDTNKHYNWCMSVSHSKRLQEANARLHDFKKCNDCGVYAQEALLQFGQMEKNMCNLSGDGWNNDREKHYNWCMNTSTTERTKESDNRKKALQTCGEIKLFAHPQYMHMVLDFCMYRRNETYSSTPIEGESYQYDFGYDCGHENVTDSYCISQGYSKTADSKISSNPSSTDTLPIGNTHICDATITRANCRGFDYIMCKKWNDSTSENPHKKINIQAKDTALKVKKTSHINEGTIVSTETACNLYAQTSVEQFHQANAALCTVGERTALFEPWKWHGDITVHYNWCLTASTAQRLNEITERDTKLQECQARHRKFYDKPTICGKRVDIYLNFRDGNKSESDVPLRAANTFCRRQGYEKAVQEWSLFNSSYKPVRLEETVHLGDDDSISGCNPVAIDDLAVCGTYPSNRNDCTAFNHIICENPLFP